VAQLVRPIAGWVGGSFFIGASPCLPSRKRQSKLSIRHKPFVRFQLRIDKATHWFFTVAQLLVTTCASALPITRQGASEGWPLCRAETLLSF
jgi:hypothetical protein